MKKIKVDYAVKKVLKDGKDEQYDLTIMLKDINANQKPFKNFANIELEPSVPLSAEEYQLICDELEITDLLKEYNSKGFRKNDCDAEVGIETNAETGEKAYLVKVQLSKSVERTCYLKKSQIINLKYINLGYEFE